MGFSVSTLLMASGKQCNEMNKELILRLYADKGSVGKWKYGLVIIYMDDSTIGFLNSK